MGVLALAILSTAAMTAPPAATVEFPRVPEASLIRLEGRLGPPRPGEKEGSDLVLRHRDKSYRFQLSRVRVLAGNQSASGIVAQITPDRPSLVLRGADAMVRRLEAAKAGERVAISGYYRTGSHDLFVSEVTLVGAPGKTAPATPPREE